MSKLKSSSKDYFVFGGCLRSELEFPDLSSTISQADPDWNLRVEESEPPASIELLGEREIEPPNWIFRLYRVENGLRLDYGGTGSYCIVPGSREIVWHPGHTPENRDTLLELARAIILGPVMALALHEIGIVCLHGSAVRIAGEAVAFLAPKFYGKSTLALALMGAGAQLVTDDMVAIDPAASAGVLPGVHSVRMHGSTVDHFRQHFREATFSSGLKTTITNLSPQVLAWEPAPLSAVYMIDPKTQADGGVGVSREIMSPIRAAVSLAHEKKLTDGLIGPARAGAVLERIVSLARNVPVYRLHVVRDLELLPEVSRVIMSWHDVETGSRNAIG